INGILSRKSDFKATLKSQIGTLTLEGRCFFINGTSQSPVKVRKKGCDRFLSHPRKSLTFCLLNN
ncbi:hypothetical protein ABHA61_04970, partial [Enterococcus faecium]